MANGETLTISRILSLTQTITIANQGDFAPQVIEEMGDTLEMQIQQVAGRTGQFRGTWITNTSYNFGDIVQDGANGSGSGNFYLCVISNISTVWATDVAAGDWTLAIQATFPTTTLPLSVTNGGTGKSVFAQGDMLYASATTTLSSLAKSPNASRYISNAGSSNNPAWSQVDLTNGVTGTLPTANGGTGTTSTTGTGALVLQTTPILITPVLGAATATSINFGGTTLSSYVEGTFIPILSFGGASVGITYNSQTGKYTKIGNAVNFTMQIVLTSKGSSTGVSLISGLPFTNSASQASLNILANAFAAGTTTSIQAVVPGSSATIAAYKYAAGAITQLADTDFSGTSNLIISGIYFV